MTDSDDCVLVDTHCHLDADAFSQDRRETIRRALDSGVSALLTIGIDAATSQAAVELSEQYPQVFAVVGIQPNYVHEAAPGDWDRIVALTDHPRVVGVGETGLDNYWDFAPADLQTEYFRRHIRLSRSSGLPFVVHCREAEAEVVAVLRQEFDGTPFRGVMHSFCGSPDIARECLDLGLHISFAGMLTFRRNEELRKTAAGIPADRLLVETDAPWLAPHPHRGKRNEPAWVRHTAECLAGLHQMNLEEMARQTTCNARRLFGLPERPLP